jgi:predicted secreted protein
MKIGRVAALAAAGLTVAVVCPAQSGSVDAPKAPAHSVAILWAQNGQTVHLHVGDEAVVTLAAAPGLGNSWQLEPLNSPVAALVNTDEAAIPPGMPGGAVNHLFHVQIKSAGTVTLRFDMLSVRMPGAKLATFTVTLTAQ